MTVSELLAVHMYHKHLPDGKTIWIVFEAQILGKIPAQPLPPLLL